MATKSEEHKVRLSGPGLSLDQTVTKEIATQIINLVMTGAVTAAPPPVTPGSSTSGAALGGSAAGGSLTPKQFVAEKRPGNNYELVTCFAYFLTKHRNTPHFKTADIAKLGTEAAKPLSNASLFVQHATGTYHYLATAGGGKKQITTLGEEIVEALPDQEKVKTVIAGHKPSRRKKRRKQKK